jgi:hypothetical protein
MYHKSIHLPFFLFLVFNSFPDSHSLASTFTPLNQLIKDHPSIEKLLIQDIFTFAFKNQVYYIYVEPILNSRDFVNYLVLLFDLYVIINSI